MIKLWQLREWWAFAHHNRDEDPAKSLVWHLAYAWYEQSGCFYTGEPAPRLSAILFRADRLRRLITRGA